MLMRCGFCSYGVTLTADKPNLDLLSPQERWGASCSCAMTVLHGRLVPDFHSENDYYHSIALHL